MMGVRFPPPALILETPETHRLQGFIVFEAAEKVVLTF